MSGDGLDFDISTAPASPQPATAAAGGYGGAAPIAGLSYRNYDGPLHSRRARWWIVALNTLRLAKQKKGFWILAAVSLLPYLVVVFFLWLRSRSPVPDAFDPFGNSIKGQVYASHMYTASNMQHFFLFLLALMVGSGSIAADNRSNALLVYLAKPITKSDYLIGKWMGVFLALFAVAFVPLLLMFLYCLLSFYSDGFLRDEPWLWLRIMVVAAVPAAIHASLILGFSAWSKTPRMAGAIYAGLYFLLPTVSTIVWGIQTEGDLARGIAVQHLSIGGIIGGLQQNVYGVSLQLQTFNRRTGGALQLSLHPPSLKIMLAIGLGLCVVGVLAARMRIRAVEVVKG